ncbi:MAG: molybdenum cofactor guanylyltransferase [Oscillospiraceae bacterium]|nr:molybdenum cofactor guanylyltransferase [Oscillospiraceae bacterium]MBR4693016.1 molybdenum cofactor guanylyltransferase [Oscillospiraceae bacterium]
MTVVILAGGQSRRMGRDKLRLTVAGETLLDRAVRRYGGIFDRVLVSVSGPDRYPALGDKRVFDRFPGAGPLAGLHAGLLEAGEDVFLTGADMPFSSPEKALLLTSLCGEKEACVLTDGDGRWEPLFGFYRRSLLPRAEALLTEGRRNMAALISAAELREVSLAELGEGPDSPLLRNVNRPEDYEKLRLELGD